MGDERYKKLEMSLEENQDIGEVVSKNDLSENEIMRKNDREEEKNDDSYEEHRNLTGRQHKNAEIKEYHERKIKLLEKQDKKLGELIEEAKKARRISI